MSTTGWAQNYIAELQEGRAVEFRPRGDSMRPKINSGELVRVEPLAGDPEVGSVVLCKVHGREFLHLVKATRGGRILAKQYQIGNNRGGINGWVSRNAIYGVVTRIGAEAPANGR